MNDYFLNNLLLSPLNAQKGIQIPPRCAKLVKFTNSLLFKSSFLPPEYSPAA